MYLFNELEGSKGEVFTSKIFRYILRHSAIFRYTFINYLNDNIKDADLTLEKWFDCESEYPTVDKETEEKGFIDLLITIDNAIIGIENKIGAEFTSRQPEKYLPTINSLAVEHERQNQCKVKSILIVFCPNVRVNAIKEKEGIKKHIVHVLSWESLLEYISKLKHKVNPLYAIIGKKEESIFETDILSEYLFENFKLFLEDYLNFIPKNDNILSDMLKQKKVSDRRSFLKRLLKHLRLYYNLKDIYVGYGAKEYYAGYYLNYYTNNENKYTFTAWFGFIPHSRIDKKFNEGFKLVVASNFTIKNDEHLIKIEKKLSKPIKINGEEAENHWIVDYQNHWTEIDNWKNVLGQFIDYNNDINN